MEAGSIEEGSSDDDDDFGVWFFQQHGQDDYAWREYEEVILGSDDGTSDSGSPSPKAGLPPSSLDPKILSQIQNTLLRFDPDNVTTKMIEDVKDLSRLVRESGGRQAFEPSDSGENSGIQALTEEVGQLSKTLQSVQKDLSSLVARLPEVSSTISKAPTTPTTSPDRQQL